MAARTVWREPTEKQAKWLTQHFPSARRKDLTMDFNDPCQADEATVRQFIQIISEPRNPAPSTAADRPGVLQLCRINPFDEKMRVPSRFQHR